eukprot:15476780-Alexandrium_andersonii.AAC.3
MQWRNPGCQEQGAADEEVEHGQHQYAVAHAESAPCRGECRAGCQAQDTEDEKAQQGQHDVLARARRAHLAEVGAVWEARCRSTLDDVVAEHGPACTPSVAAPKTCRTPSVAAPCRPVGSVPVLHVEADERVGQHREHHGRRGAIATLSICARTGIADALADALTDCGTRNAAADVDEADARVEKLQREPSKP